MYVVHTIYQHIQQLSFLIFFFGGQVHQSPTSTFPFGLNNWVEIDISSMKK
jgi:hypothetical protein